MPSHHSGSSHSSSSHSSHSSHSAHTSHHSSSSHSSFSRSYSSSSGSSWGSFRGSSRNASSGPSRHSGTSRSYVSGYRSRYVRDGSLGSIIHRDRTNQPRGYVAVQHSGATPVNHYCVHHNYLYYPFDWTDAETGKAYKKGYYDEDGQYYQHVAFREDGKYKDVLCQCEYCDTTTKIDWSEGGSLICPQCGGTMKLLSTLDEYTRDPNYETVLQSGVYEPVGSYSSDRAPSKLVKIIPIIIVALFYLLSAGVFDSSSRSSGEPEIGYRGNDGMVYYGNGTWVKNGNWDDFNETQLSPEGEPGENLALYNPDLFGYEIYLCETASGAYGITDLNSGTRTLVWDDSEESYYDRDTELWAWYNTDVTPSLWQYWYEPISGDYGDYGWMEYEGGVWYIEANAGNWIPVPDRYDTSSLWHIDYNPAD